MNKAISRLFMVGVVLFLALIVNLTWIMVVRADWYADRPENKQNLAKELRIERGDITGFDGSVIASSRRRSGYYQREYPQGTVAPQLVGYDSAQYGRSGLERQYNDELTGQTGALGLENWADWVLGRKPVGADVRADAGPGGAEGGSAGAQGKEGRDRGPRPEDGSVDRLRFGPHLRPGAPRRHVAAAQPGRGGSAAESADAGALRAGLVVQGRHIRVWYLETAR